MRTILGCVAILAVALGVSAADEKIDARKLVGKWEPADVKKSPAMTLEFTADGKLHLVVGPAGKEIKIDGTYKVDGSKLEVALKFMGDDRKESLTIRTLTDEELVTEDAKGKSETLKKK